MRREYIKSQESRLKTPNREGAAPSYGPGAVLKTSVLRNNIPPPTRVIRSGAKHERRISLMAFSAAWPYGNEAVCWEAAALGPSEGAVEKVRPAMSAAAYLCNASRVAVRGWRWKRHALVLGRKHVRPSKPGRTDRQNDVHITRSHGLNLVSWSSPPFFVRRGIQRVPGTREDRAGIPSGQTRRSASGLVPSA